MKNKLLIILSVILILIATAVILYKVNNREETTVTTTTPVYSTEEKEEYIEEEEVFVIVLSDDKEEQIEEIGQEETDQSEEIYVDENTEFYIKVNNLANVVTIYIKDGDNLVPYKAMICSTGTDTPEDGIYEIKSRWNWLALFGNVYGKYATQIVGNILFHSVPYLEKSSDTLEYWEYDKLGTSASMGCIRLTVEDAKWIYDNISRGTEVEFYSSEEPGPLGKPEAQKISDNEECRNWDPTDEDPDNPWNN